MLPHQTLCPERTCVVIYMEPDLNPLYRLHGRGEPRMLPPAVVAERGAARRLLCL